VHINSVRSEDAGSGQPQHRRLHAQVDWFQVGGQSRVRFPRNCLRAPIQCGVSERISGPPPGSGPIRVVDRSRTDSFVTRTRVREANRFTSLPVPCFRRSLRPAPALQANYLIRIATRLPYTGSPNAGAATASRAQEIETTPDGVDVVGVAGNARATAR
jgi:hypothetical protein